MKLNLSSKSARWKLPAKLTFFNNFRTYSNAGLVAWLVPCAVARNVPKCATVDTIVNWRGHRRQPIAIAGRKVNVKPWFRATNQPDTNFWGASSRKRTSWPSSVVGEWVRLLRASKIEQAVNSFVSFCAGTRVFCYFWCRRLADNLWSNGSIGLRDHDLLPGKRRPQKSVSVYFSFSSAVIISNLWVSYKMGGTRDCGVREGAWVRKPRSKKKKKEISLKFKF